MEPRNPSSNIDRENNLATLRTPPTDRKSERLRKQAEIASIAEEALSELQVAVSNGQPEPLKRLLTTMAMFHSYSLRNVILILSQNPDATRVAGFRTWKKLGRQVRKGEKGICILAPMTGQKADNEGTPEAGDQSQKQRLIGFRIVYVFDVSQTEGDPLPTLSQIQGQPGKHLVKLRDLIRFQGIQLEYQSLNQAKGISKGGKIVMDSKLGKAEEFAVLAHELAHEMLHHGDDKRELSQTQCETEAEAVAYVVCSAFDIDSKDRSNEYIQLYKGNTELLSDSLEAIRMTATSIIGELREVDPEPS